MDMTPVPMESMYPETSEHRCHWPGCPEIIPPRLWGCRVHWLMLPQGYRRGILEHYRKGQEHDKRPSREYVQTARAAQVWAEGFEAATAALDSSARHSFEAGHRLGITHRVRALEDARMFVQSALSFLELSDKGRDGCLSAAIMRIENAEGLIMLLLGERD